ncbi:MAG: hypothetical protein R6X05_05840 [Desulfobacterales bacterium]
MARSLVIIGVANLICVLTSVSLYAAVFRANWSAPADGLPFWVLFALFFPAVTGFTQGVSMSGDLKDPGESLPLGTFLAVGASIVVYFGAAVIFGGALSSQALTADYAAINRVDRFSGLIDAGVIAATLSSTTGISAAGACFKIAINPFCASMTPICWNWFVSSI